LLRAALLIGAAFAFAGSTENGAAFAVSFLVTMLKLWIIWLVVAKIARFNLLGYLLLAAGLALFGAGTSLIAQPNAYLRNNGVIVLGVLALLLLWPLAAWLRGTRDAASIPVSS
jgi:hypothetical protein